MSVHMLITHNRFQRAVGAQRVKVKTHAANTLEHSAQQPSHLSFHILITRNPFQRAVGYQMWKLLFGQDLGLGLCMQPHVSIARTHLAT